MDMSGPFILRPRFESQPPTRFLNILNNTLWVFKFGLNCENENEEFLLKNNDFFKFLPNILKPPLAVKQIFYFYL